MHYLIGRDIDGDGYPEFVQNLDTMALTEDPFRALQFTTAELAYIDMPYLNSLGFYAIEAPNYGVALLTNLLFRPTVRGYRPRMAPPPRRPRPVRPVPPHHMGPGYPHPMPRGPIGPGPVGPGPRGPMGGPLGGPMGGPGRGPGGRGGRGGMGGPGRGPGGFGY